MVTFSASAIFAAPALAGKPSAPPTIVCPVGEIAVNGVCAAPTPDQALQLLLAGNAKFVAGGGLDHLEAFSIPKVRTEVAAGQKPYAIILACSDSRVPPEILFNRGLGEIFVVRVAGNVVDKHELGSIEYAVEHLHAKLIIVLGHERCGAVTTAWELNGQAVTGSENLDSLVTSIAPAVAETKQAGLTVEDWIVSNINHVKASLVERSAIIKERTETLDSAHLVKIVKAKYNLDTGVVKVLP